MTGLDVQLDDPVDHLMSVEEIRQLVSRYAVALDARDMAAMAGLFVDDVQTADGRQGREALADWLDSMMRPFSITFHLVGNHVIDFQDDTHATGIVYCRPEHKVDDKWIVMPMQYWDRYERREGHWWFKSRSPHVYYAADVNERPDGAPGRFHFPNNPLITKADMPERLATWQDFWDQGESDAPET